MAVPNEGTTALPSDNAGRFFVGGWDGAAFQALRADANKSLRAALYGPDGNPLLPTAAAIADGAANPVTTAIDARLSTWNGTSWNRLQGNSQGAMLALAARTATTNAPNIPNPNARGLMLFLNVTVASGTGGLQLFVQNVNPTGSTLPITLGNTPVFTAVGRYALLVYPGATTALNDVKTTLSSALAAEFTAYVQVSDASSYTYALDYALFN